MSFFEVASIKNAKIQAFRGSILEFKGGVVFGQECPSIKNMLRQTRYWEPCDSFDENVSASINLSGQFIYGGPIYNHFGHFMSEMVHRIVRARRIWGGGKVLFVTSKGASNSKNSLPYYIRDILKFLDLTSDEYEIVSEDCVVEDLLVVEAGSDFGGGPKVGYVDELAAWGAGRFSADKDAPRRLFVSRSGIKQGGIFLGESYLEDWLSSAGFTAFHPEKFSFSDQIEAYRSAESIIFSEGSACHGVELLGASSLGRTLILNRRHSHEEIFARVLRPRSAEFQSHVIGSDLGTALVRAESKIPLYEFSVSLIDPDLITKIIDEFGYPVPDRFDINQYSQAAEADLYSYIDYFNKNPSDLISISLADEVRSKFYEEMSRLR
ncbi:glycosyltransferase 61 family protein [Xanthobacter wiegelii]|uniref:glycosyltransferase 61 family protein n=1 Tax=Xanthobacter wiegelii TaxID=3119913 RepID=UPI00372A1B1C